MSLLSTADLSLPDLNSSNAVALVILGQFHYQAAVFGPHDTGFLLISHRARPATAQIEVVDRHF